MTASGIFQLALYVVVLLALAKPLGAYMARVYEHRPIGLDRVLGLLERLIYRLCGIRPTDEMGWKTYTVAMLVFNLVGLLVVYGLQRVQGVLPLNPQGLAAVSPDSSFNTAVSFATNTNWQGYGAGPGPGRRRRGDEYRDAGGQGSRQHGRSGLEPDQAARGRGDR